MKTKSPFLLCKNPILDIDDAEFILHTQQPRFVARVVAHTNYESIISGKDNDHDVTFFYSTRDVTKTYTISLEFMIDNLSEENIKDLIKKIADWYYHYLIFSAKNPYQIYEKTEIEEILAMKSFLVDYNPSAPELKIIYSCHSEKWMIIFRDIAKTFNTWMEMDDFLASIGFNDKDMGGGMTNKFYVED